MKLQMGRMLIVQYAYPWDKFGCKMWALHKRQICLCGISFTWVNKEYLEEQKLMKKLWE